MRLHHKELENLLDSIPNWIKNVLIALFWLLIAYKVALYFFDKLE